MTQARLPDGFAVQVDRRVRVLARAPLCWVGLPPGYCGWRRLLRTCLPTAGSKSATQ